jgi:glycosyltransferase involved in cell wall biosynthesis
MPSPKELWLFTIRYPFGNGEPFLANELPVLCKGFSRIKIFPLFAEGAPRAVPENVEVVQLFGSDVYRSLPLVRVAARWRRWWRVFRMCQSSAPSAAVSAKHRRRTVSRLRQAFYRESVLLERCAAAYHPQNVVLYSYWCSDWATVLGLWKMKDARVRFIGRVMGFDLYDHRVADGWQVFQAFHVHQAERIYPSAKAGLQYLQSKYGAHRHKFRLGHMATEDHGPAHWAPSSVLRIVSCGNLIPLKRVHLLIEALAEMSTAVEWTHFGDGPERVRCEAMASQLPGHVRVQWMGNRPNQEVLAWYKNNAVDVCVHTSETEGGVPVALQEAASFGIPLLAMDAGGVSEIVTPATGVLLPHTPSAGQLARVLSEWRQGSWYSTQAREGVRGFWRVHFLAEEVYGRWLKELLDGRYASE